MAFAGRFLAYLLPTGDGPARARLDDDEALLAEMSVVLDSLPAHFGRPARAKS